MNKSQLLAIYRTTSRPEPFSTDQSVSDSHAKHSLIQHFLKNAVDNVELAKTRSLILEVMEKT